MMPEEVRNLALECQDFLNEIVHLEELLKLAIEQINLLDGNIADRLRLLIECYQVRMCHPTDELEFRLKCLSGSIVRTEGDRPIE